MQTLTIGDVIITSIIECDGPWRRPRDMFPACDPDIGQRHLAELDPVVDDPASDRMVITYQTFVVRTPKHGILVDTGTGDDRGCPAPMDFPKRPWLDGFRAAGLQFDAIDYVRCTHLHIDHCGWNTILRNGRWVPTFPKAKYVFHEREYPAWEEATKRGDNPSDNVRLYNCLPIVEAGQALLADDDYSLEATVWLTPTVGHSPSRCCVIIKSRGQRSVMTGDLMHHALQCREPDWSTIFDWDAKEAAASRRRFGGSVADTGTVVQPIHFPNPTTARVRADGNRFRYESVR